MIAKTLRGWLSFTDPYFSCLIAHALFFADLRLKRSLSSQFLS